MQPKENLRGRGKYSMLSDYLRAQTGDRITLSFTTIEAIIDSPLPPSARTPVNRWWWRNHPGRYNSDAWLNAGWRLKHVDYGACEATFIRNR
jgi:hypothetical protein